MSASADRLAAARLLLRVEGGAFASRLLGGAGRPGVRARVLAVLRWLRRLDAATDPFLGSRAGRLDPEVRQALRLGLAETAVLGAPPPVAVDGAVHLVRRLGKGSASGLVNAVLRRAVRAWEELEEEAPPDLAWSHPRWLFERWVEAFGEEAARAAVRVDQLPAEVWVWWPGGLPEEGAVALREHPWCPGAWGAPGADAVLAGEAAAGWAYVQDPSSQLAAHLAVALGGEGTLVDLCAAPGGKAVLAARLGRWSRVVACDLSPRRLALVGGLAERAGVPVDLLVGDAGRPAVARGAARVVLLDAPCSGTGTLRRHPELKWRLEPGAIGRIARRQARMIGAALPLLAPGGVLLYTTCSLEPEENEAHFASIPPGFERVDPGPLLPPGVPAAPTPAGGRRLFPGEHWDGFVFHALRRVG